MAEVRPVMTASQMPQNLGAERARTIKMTRKLSGVGGPMAQMCSFSSCNSSDVSASGFVDVYRTLNASCISCICETVPCRSCRVFRVVHVMRAEWQLVMIASSVGEQWVFMKAHTARSLIIQLMQALGSRSLSGSGTSPSR